MITIILTPMSFYASHDEDALFFWLKKIKSIKEIKGIGEELHLQFESNDIPDNDLRSLFAVFVRYKFKDMFQLKVFVTDKNKTWVELKKKYWYKKIFESLSK